MRSRLQELLQESDEYSDMRIKSTKILNFLIHDILDFSLLQSDKFRMNIICFDIEVAVNEIIEILSFRAGQMGVGMVADFENFEVLAEKQRQESGEQIRGIKINMDKDRLQQIIMNLVSNAIKFTKAGGQIKVVARYVECCEDLTYQHDTKLKDAMKNATHGALEMQVIDNGIGITEANQKKLFRLFGCLKDSK